MTDLRSPHLLSFVGGRDRSTWQTYRQIWEEGILRQGKEGPRVSREGPLFRAARRFFHVNQQKTVGQLLQHNALRPKYNQIDMVLDNLPPKFDGYKILHISDFHLDLQPGLEEYIAQELAGKCFDLVVFTGDYQDSYRLNPFDLVAPLTKIIQSFHSIDGIIATLGNHDSYRSAAMLESLGIHVLINERVRMGNGSPDSTIYITGLDDVHFFYSSEALKALQNKPEGFNLLLVHSPEVFREAAALGYDLYLAGHTHGGQVCLPTGIPVITHSDSPRRLSQGHWRVGKLSGYTSRGAGASGIPMRLNCPGELTCVRLLQPARRPIVGASDSTPH